MYLGNNSVRTLETYVQGYVQARRDLGLPEFGGEEEGLLDDFGKWLAVKMKSKRNFSWAGHVEIVDPSSNNVLTFFREFDDFAKMRGIALTPELADQWPPNEWSSKDWSPPL
jgi:hypothetical protein